MKEADMNNEIELRFNERWMDGVSFGTFEKIHEFFKNSKWKSSKSTSSSVIGRPLSQGTNVRRLTNGTNVMYERKVSPRLTKPRLFLAMNLKDEYNIKISEAREERYDITNNKFNKEYVIFLERNRERFSYTHGNWRFDLTVVNKEKYEVEMEYIGKAKSTFGLEKNLNLILCLIQGSSTIHKNSQLDMVVKKYRLLAEEKMPVFIGPLPFTLQKKDLPTISCGYAVTDKADGVRFLLFIQDDGNTYKIARPKTQAKIINPIFVGRSLLSCSNTILDGELVGKTFFTFDAVVVNKHNVSQLSLQDRLVAASTIIAKNSYKLATIASSMPKTVEKLDIKLDMKTFYLSKDGGTQQLKVRNGISSRIVKTESIFDAAEQIWAKKSKKYKTDGLIFQPMFKPYSNRYIFKWKQVNTIDFFVTQESNTWILHFAGDKEGKFMNIRFNSQLAIYKDQTLTDNLRKGIIPIPKNADKFKTNSVIEFKFDKNTFKPVGSRPDKTLANAFGSVNDAWFSIKENIQVNQLFVYKSCLRGFHNEIKDYLIKGTSGKTVLDLGSGAGGDIAKYAKYKTKYVVGIDIVPVQYNVPANMKFLKVNNPIYSTKKLTQGILFDVVNCQFALHYFFESQSTLDNLTKNLKESLKPGGIFVATLLNGDVIHPVLIKGDFTGGYKKNQVFEVKKKYTNYSLVGNEITVKLEGTKYFENKVSKEYLVPVGSYINYMSSNGFTLIMHKQFIDYCKMFPEMCSLMNPAEKDYSFCNIALIFQKK
jgi:SAM-dependent methyltransferase